MKPLIVFQTDFTYKEGAIAAMYGVVKRVDRDLQIHDATHEIPQYDIWSASYRLMQYPRFWPEDTIFVSVVDPGVGTARRPCAARLANGQTIITPDNGTLTHIALLQGIREVREIDTATHRLRGFGTEETNVFHGRDVFGYNAARLASGQVRYEDLGPAYDPAQIVTLPVQAPYLQPGYAAGIFEIGDPNFGNLWTNIPVQAFMAAGFAYGDQVAITVRQNGEVRWQATLPFQPSFGYAQPGEPMLYTNELMNVAAAINQGSLISTFGLGYGPGWQVELAKGGSAI